MMRGDPSWLAGYYAGLKADVKTTVTIVSPADYTLAQFENFASGFAIGARDQRNNALIEELQRGFE